MSAPAKQSKADSKRVRDSGGPANPAATSEDRSVRQRIDPSGSPAAKVGSSSAVDASSATAAPSPAVVSSAITPARSFMRLAVVERQLIMQRLDLTSLARLASTCKQLRVEAMHKEAGKLIPEPEEGSALRQACSIDESHPAHASPLFRKHVPMCLGLGTRLRTLAGLEALIDKTASFSRVSMLSFFDDIPWWTDDRAVRLLSLPCMQELRRVWMNRSPNWIKGLRIQTALFGLPHLKSVDLADWSALELLPGAITSASKLVKLYVHVSREHVASVRSLRTLRFAPALTSLVCSVSHLPWTQPMLTELVRCLPLTLTHLNLELVDISPGLPRPLIKALFSRTPLLQTLELTGSIETILRGLLDAGLHALPMLRRLLFHDVAPDDFSFDEDPDPIPALLRGFLHRFPKVIVRFQIDAEDWEDEEQWSAMLERYLAWPRVELYRAGSDDPERIGGPPSPHSSDDDDGSDVEDLADPLAAEAH